MANYIVNTSDEQKEMLKEIGRSSIDELFEVIPAPVRLKELKIPLGKSEIEVKKDFQVFVELNKEFKDVFLGAGSYKHFIPAVVSNLASREEFVSAYTPYQAEISQGTLQSIFEYQTMMCELTGLDASNASVYDGASAIAEAIIMSLLPNKRKVLIAETLHPEYKEVIKTYFNFLEVELVFIKGQGTIDLNFLKTELTEDVAAVVYQIPNFYGIFEDSESIYDLTQKVTLIGVVNPTVLGLINPPKVDIMVGEGQPLGLPLAYGGPYLGYMACTSKLARKLPGRIVGETEDLDGKRAYTLTLQAREQHIRREKASSSICSNQALCALTSSIYLASLGPVGFNEVASACYQHAHYLQEELAKLGFKLVYEGEFFHEFLTTSPIEVTKLMAYLEKNNILGGLIIEDKILWCATELNDVEVIDNLIKVIKEVI